MENKTETELESSLPDNKIFGPVPRSALIHECGEHTAHHRGALCVYQRQLGIEPPRYWE
ncbi:DinB family protein [Gemmatimonadota bacterium]